MWTKRFHIMIYSNRLVICHPIIYIFQPSDTYVYVCVESLSLRDNTLLSISWWRHQMETFSALLANYAGNSPVSGDFPAQRPATRSFDVFFDQRPNKRLSKQSWGWWFETHPPPLWRDSNVPMSFSRWMLIYVWFVISDMTIFTGDFQSSNCSWNHRWQYHHRLQRWPQKAPFY